MITDLPGKKGLLVLLVGRVKTEQRENREAKDHLALRGPLDPKAHLETGDSLVFQALLVQPA